MSDEYLDILEARLEKSQFEKLAVLEKPFINKFVAETVDLCKPASVFVSTDIEDDVHYVRRKAVDRGEEQELETPGHTFHFDGYFDQARDKENTRYLLPQDVHLGKHINHMNREKGLKEVLGLLENSMAGSEMLIHFYCLGPGRSVFSQLCCQITDSFYVAHSENLLYRPGYEEIKNAGKDVEIFRFLHSAGRLEGGVSADVEKRRIYIDLEENLVYSVNTQYGGNTMGLKKLAMRLGVSKSLREGWLTEHMFIVGIPSKGDRVTYVTGAFPSLCGKTSTAMLSGLKILGDDIAYLKKVDGEVRAVNVESGIFGIIQDINANDDPSIYEALTSPGELIFSNVLVKDGTPYWTGMGRKLPSEGVNYSGKWKKGKKDEKGNAIDPSHKNARFTIKIDTLANCDPHLDDPAGAPVGGMVFGGRDSDTSVPVEQSFDWAHGVITKGASLESETTAATLGKEGVRKFNPMSNLDFLAASLDTYIGKYLEFAQNLDNPPPIFSVNYFLRNDDGNFLNGMQDKKVWLLWIDRRINGRVDALGTPTGLIPLYKDLEELFAEAIDAGYTEDQYKIQFTVRVPEQLAKIKRVQAIYRGEWGIPEIVFAVLEEQKKRLEESRAMFGDYVSPLLLSQR